MGDYVVLYKEGEPSPPLHPVDATGWRSLGWTDTPGEVEPKATKQDPPATNKKGGTKNQITIDPVPPFGMVPNPATSI